MAATQHRLCTGALNEEDGSIAHDGPTCPIHEEAPRFAVLVILEADEAWRARDRVAGQLKLDGSVVYVGDAAPTPHADEYGTASLHVFADGERVRLTPRRD